MAAGGVAPVAARQAGLALVLCLLVLAAVPARACTAGAPVGGRAPAGPDLLCRRPPPNVAGAPSHATCRTPPASPHPRTPPPPAGSFKLDLVESNASDDPLVTCGASLQINIAADCKVRATEEVPGFYGTAPQGHVPAGCRSSRRAYRRPLQPVSPFQHRLTLCPVLAVPPTHSQCRGPCQPAFPQTPGFRRRSGHAIQTAGRRLRRGAASPLRPCPTSHTTTTATPLPPALSPCLSLLVPSGVRHPSGHRLTLGARRVVGRVGTDRPSPGSLPHRRERQGGSHRRRLCHRHRRARRHPVGAQRICVRVSAGLGWAGGGGGSIAGCGWRLRVIAPFRTPPRGAAGAPWGSDARCP